MIHFHIISLFPETIEPYLNSSMLWRAQKEKKAVFQVYNPREFTKHKNNKVDDKPYGGGPGMVLTAQPILDTVKAIQKKTKGKKTKAILFAPAGKQFTNTYAKTLSKKYEHIILICGRYEGIDARVKKILKAEELTIGPYVLTGGEVPALVVVDSVTRQIEGVLGNADSIEENRIASSEFYTRPESLEWEGKTYKVPKVLREGNHAKIDAWREKKNKKK